MFTWKIWICKNKSMGTFLIKFQFKSTYAFIFSHMSLKKFNFFLWEHSEVKWIFFFVIFFIGWFYFIMFSLWKFVNLYQTVLEIENIYLFKYIINQWNVWGNFKKIKSFEVGQNLITKFYLSFTFFILGMVDETKSKSWKYSFIYIII